jgi:hypothetical protein
MVHQELIISVVRMRELFYRECVHRFRCALWNCTLKYIVPSSYYFRTRYYTTYRQTFHRTYQTKYRCCKGWKQLNGEAGCQYSKSQFLQINPSLDVHIRVFSNWPHPRMFRVKGFEYVMPPSHGIWCDLPMNSFENGSVCIMHGSVQIALRFLALCAWLRLDLDLHGISRSAILVIACVLGCWANTILW